MDKRLGLYRAVALGNDNRVSDIALARARLVDLFNKAALLGSNVGKLNVRTNQLLRRGDYISLGGRHILLDE